MITFKVPKQIQVGGHTYTIGLSKDLKDSNSNAAVNHRLLAILIDDDRPESQKIEGLFHEVIHIISHVYGVDLEEAQVDCLGQGIFQVFAQLGIELDWSDIPVRDWHLP